MHSSSGKALSPLLLFPFILAASSLSAGKAAAQEAEMPSTANLARTIDLPLPAWGPYSKVHPGISHIADVPQGLRFDLSVFPSSSGSAVRVPKVWQASPRVFHPLLGTPTLEFYSFRHDILPNDQAYADISYLTLNDSTRLVRMACVNNSPGTQTADLYLAASMCFPDTPETTRKTAKDYPAQELPVLPAGAAWFDAENYAAMDFLPPNADPAAAASHSSPFRFLQDDGRVRGEIRGDDWVSGSAITLGQHPGDYLEIPFTAANALPEAALVFRAKGGSAAFQVQIDGRAAPILRFSGNQGITALNYDAGALSRGQHILRLSTSMGSAEIDGFALCAAPDAGKVSFQRKPRDPVPVVTPGSGTDSVVLKYADVPQVYGLHWFFPQHDLRSCSGGDLEQALSASKEPSPAAPDNGFGHYTVITLPGIALAPKSTRVVYAVVCAGTPTAVNATLQSREDEAAWERLYATERQKAIAPFDCLPDGERYRFSQQVLAATLLTNAAFPMHADRSYVRTFTPGKCWDSFYTWDSGMIGVGMTALSLPLSTEFLNSYLSAPGAQSAFLHHGSMLPTQIFHFQELWNRTQSRELLAYLYPRLKYYYQFMAGHLPGSTLDRLNSRLLTPWDYFYNSGGWDDYPPQVNVHANHLESVCAPAITTAQVIRMAKILTQAAVQLDLRDDVNAYAADIKQFTAALQQYAWDPASGYYGYVLHDAAGKPTGILRAPNGENFNMGLGGTSPLIAGICSSEQQAKLLEHLKTKGQIWSDVGLSTVDQSASYYKKTGGYWNGSVWFPHQWMLWKSMLDLGEAQFADQIAVTALDVWKKGVEESHGTFEFCRIANGKADGWPQFSGLSSPLLNWFFAYFHPGTVTSGFDLWVTKTSFGPNNRGLALDFRLPEVITGRKSSLLICLDPSSSYDVKLNDRSVPVRVLRAGSLSIDVPWTQLANHLAIAAH
jgi:hypothetical protein